MHDKEFIFIEDDAKMVNFLKFHSEVCSARMNNLQFYSFYQTTNQVEDWAIHYKLLSNKYGTFSVLNLCKLGCSTVPVCISTAW